MFPFKHGQVLRMYYQAMERSNIGGSAHRPKAQPGTQTQTCNWDGQATIEISQGLAAEIKRDPRSTSVDGYYCEERARDG
jgi:hypothetical protein